MPEPANPDQPISFGTPPVTEVAFAVQFGAGAIDLERLGAIAARVKPTLPMREQYAPLLPMFEDFSSPLEGPKFFMQGPQELPRTWFISEDRQRLLQAQSDRLVYNWRRIAPEVAYPRYVTLKPEFVAHLRPVINEILESGVGLSVNAVEVTYVNELRAPESVPNGPRPDLSRFLKSVSPFEKQAFLDEPEDMRLEARWRIYDGGDPIGRFYSTAEPAIRADGIATYQLSVTARLISQASELESVVRLLDTAHEWVVRGFEDLTTEEMHMVWEKEASDG